MCIQPRSLLFFFGWEAVPSWRDSPRSRVGAGAPVDVLSGRTLDGDNVLLGLQAGGPGLDSCLDGAVGYRTLAGRCAPQVRHRVLHLSAESHGRLWGLRDGRFDVQLNLRLGVDFAPRQGGRLQGDRSSGGLDGSRRGRRAFGSRRGCGLEQSNDNVSRFSLESHKVQEEQVSN